MFIKSYKAILSYNLLNKNFGADAGALNPFWAQNRDDFQMAFTTDTGRSLESPKIQR